MNKKLILRIFIVLIVMGGIGGIVVYKMWTKPHPKAEDEKGIAITTTVLAKEYGTDEKAADAKYLDKWIEVTGTVSETEKNQDGGLMVILQTEDPTAGVQCAMREKNISVNKGQTVTMKGKCSGNGITGVTLTDCIITP